jgi:hypothetical protein
MSFALQVSGHGENVRVRPQWEDPAPIAEREYLENLILKKRLGVAAAQLLREAGYGDADITQMLSEPPVVTGG